MKNFTISGAIFDLDGTLLDSMMIWEDFASAYLRSRGIEPPAGLEARLESLTLSDAAEYLRKAFSLKVCFTPSHDICSHTDSVLIKSALISAIVCDENIRSASSK